MAATPLPPNESDRLRALSSYAVLDTPQEAAYDAITRLASQICGTPISLITLLNEERQWFKSAYGTGFKETPREYAFCNHAILQPHRPLIVPDLRLDERFQTNPLVTEGPHAVFYAGVPLTDGEGFALGSLCVIDTQENNLTAFQVEALQTLAGQVVVLLQLHRKLKTAQTIQRLLEERADELQKGMDAWLSFRPVVDELLQTLAILKESTTLSDKDAALPAKAEKLLAQFSAAMERAKENTRDTAHNLG